MIRILSALLVAIIAGGCDYKETTDELQSKQQAAALEQAHAKVGMPAINDFSEKRMMKDLYELRDKPFPTHTYIVNDFQGCLVYLGNSVGFGLPYGTQFTAPTRTEYRSGVGFGQFPQAEPNGLFMPSSAEGTWVMLKDPNGDQVQPVYVEQRVIVSPFKLPNAECKPADRAK